MPSKQIHAKHGSNKRVDRRKPVKGVSGAIAVSYAGRVPSGCCYHPASGVRFGTGSDHTQLNRTSCKSRLQKFPVYFASLSLRSLIPFHTFPPSTEYHHLIADKAQPVGTEPCRASNVRQNLLPMLTKLMCPSTGVVVGDGAVGKVCLPYQSRFPHDS